MTGNCSCTPYYPFTSTANEIAERRVNRKYWKDTSFDRRVGSLHMAANEGDSKFQPSLCPYRFSDPANKMTMLMLEVCVPALRHGFLSARPKRKLNAEPVGTYSYRLYPYDGWNLTGIESMLQTRPSTGWYHKCYLPPPHQTCSILEKDILTDVECDLELGCQSAVNLHSLHPSILEAKAVRQVSACHYQQQPDSNEMQNANPDREKR